MAKRVREKAEKRAVEKDTRPQAHAMYIRMSPSKAKRTLDLIRGKSYIEAVAILENINTAASDPVQKVLKSAAANAEVKGFNRDDLGVVECFANPGPTMKRGIWRGRGGHDVIIKRSCHITVVLDSVK